VVIKKLRPCVLGEYESFAVAFHSDARRSHASTSVLAPSTIAAVSAMKVQGRVLVPQVRLRELRELVRRAGKAGVGTRAELRRRGRVRGRRRGQRERRERRREPASGEDDDARGRGAIAIGVGARARRGGDDADDAAVARGVARHRARRCRGRSREGWTRATRA
jgi:hypothetical protein